MISPVLVYLLVALAASVLAQEPVFLGSRTASSSHHSTLLTNGGRDIALINLTEHIENWVANQSLLENQTLSWWSLFGNSFVNATATVTPLPIKWDPEPEVDYILDNNTTSNPVLQKIYWFHNTEKTNVTCSYVEEKFPLAWIDSKWSREAKLVLDKYLRYDVPRSPMAEQEKTHVAQFDEDMTFGAITASSIATTFHTAAILNQTLESNTSVKWELVYPRRRLVHNWNMKYCFKGDVAVQYQGEANVTYYPLSELADDSHFIYNDTTECLLYTEQGSFTANDTVDSLWIRVTVHPLLSNATADSRCIPSSSSTTNLHSMPSVVFGFLFYVLLAQF